MEVAKPVKTVVLDAGPIIKNEPSVSTLLAKAENLVTTPAVISEIRDATTRARVETTLMPFLEIKQPSALAVKFVQDFARKTGDLAVLSRPDIEIIALAYDLECDLNGGDWRLRKEPGQKRTNGPPPRNNEETESAPAEQSDLGSKTASRVPDEAHDERKTAPGAPWATDREALHLNPTDIESDANKEQSNSESTQAEAPSEQSNVARGMSTLAIDETPGHSVNSQAGSSVEQSVSNEQPSNAKIDSDSSSSDSEGWITPSNIKRRQLEDEGAHGQSSAEPQVMQVATITSDFAMQNVLLRINLNLLSLSLQRVKHLKTFVLRCHACFQTTKDMAKQFCPRCGQPALTRVACSTNANGEFKLHLKKNMQWNHRGKRYSIPKPTSGAANGRVKGGGKGGWGNDLILAEDQKEYSRAVAQENRDKKVAELMDADYLPAMFSGSGKRDGKPGGRPRVGAGRTVNSRKR